MNKQQLNNNETGLTDTNREESISDIQKYLARHNLDGWLVYEYDGLNPLSGMFLGSTPHLATRRWLYFIPRSGDPVYLFHVIEDNLPRSYPGNILVYRGWRDFYQQFEHILAGCGRIAMEYSPRCALPSISRIDAGTIEVLKDLGIEPVSSAELIQFFTCRLDRSQFQSHIKAAEALYKIKGIILKNIKNDLENGFFPTEYQVQQRYLVQFEKFNMVTEFPPIVAVNDHAGDPHYQPDPDHSHQIRPGCILLLDTWAKMKENRAVYSDITWMAFLGETVPPRFREIFNVVIEARDAVIEELDKRYQADRSIMGFEADDIARNIISGAGYGDFFNHRTGHNLGTDVHGAGANLDNLETHEERELIPQTAFTVEPGIYLPEFGVRSEINVFYDPREGFQVTTPPQREITLVKV